MTKKIESITFMEGDVIKNPLSGDIGIVNSMYDDYNIEFKIKSHGNAMATTSSIHPIIDGVYGWKLASESDLVRLLDLMEESLLAEGSKILSNALMKTLIRDFTDLVDAIEVTQDYINKNYLESPLNNNNLVKEFRISPVKVDFLEILSTGKTLLDFIIFKDMSLRHPELENTLRNSLVRCKKYISIKVR